MNLPQPRFTTGFLVAAILSTLASSRGFAQDLSALWQAPEGQARRASSRNPDPASNFDCMVVAPGAEVPLAQLEGPGVITHLWMTVDCQDPHYSRMLVLRAFWDGEKQPSVEVPIGDFFGVGHALDREVQSRPVQVLGEGRSRNCYWPMPFDRSADLTLRNDSALPVGLLYYHVDWLKREQPFGERLRTFHACYGQSDRTRLESTYVAAEIGGTGHYVGTVLSIASAEDGWPGEGDDLFFLDDETSASLSGTGTEDYFCNAWGFRVEQGLDSGVSYFEGTMAGARSSAYRWHLQDPIPFARGLKVGFERMGWAIREGRWQVVNDRPDHFSSVSFWYQKEPHRLLAPLPIAKERLPFFEDRIELEDAVDRVHVDKDAPRPVRQSDRFWAYGAQLFFAAKTLEQAWLVLPFKIETERDYDLALRWTTSYDFPVVEVRLDGERLAGPCDLYSPASRIEEKLLGRRHLALGEHLLEIRALSKHLLSQGFFLGIDSFLLRWGR